MIVFVNRHIFACKMMPFHIKRWFLVVYIFKIVTVYLLVWNLKSYNLIIQNKILPFKSLV